MFSKSPKGKIYQEKNRIRQKNFLPDLLKCSFLDPLERIHCFWKKKNLYYRGFNVSASDANKIKGMLEMSLTANISKKFYIQDILGIFPFLELVIIVPAKPFSGQILCVTVWRKEV